MSPLGRFFNKDKKSNQNECNKPNAEKEKNSEVRMLIRSIPHEELLKREFRLIRDSKDQWVFKEGAVFDKFAEFYNADKGYSALNEFRKDNPFNQICMIRGGQKSLIICNTKPLPSCIVTSMSITEDAYLVNKLIQSDGKVILYMCTTLVILPPSDFLKHREIQNQQSDSAVQPLEQPKSVPMETSTLPKEEIVLYAFLAQARTYGLPGFNRTIILTHSLEEWKDKIRQSVGCPQSDVFILEPKEWNPPEITTVSQAELAQKLPIITSRVQEKMKELNLPDASSAELVRGGSVMPNPASGKVFFVYKVPKVRAKQEPMSGKGRIEEPDHKDDEYWHTDSVM